MTCGAPDSAKNFSNVIPREFLKYLEANTGEEITRLCQVDWIYDTLLIESIYNKVKVENTTRSKNSFIFCNPRHFPHGQIVCFLVGILRS